MLLRSLDALERWIEERKAEQRKQAEAGTIDVHTGKPVEYRPDHWPKYTPLYTGEMPFEDEDVLLAAKEAAKMGHVDLVWSELGPMVRITEEGRGFVRFRFGHAPGKEERDG